MRAAAVARTARAYRSRASLAAVRPGSHGAAAISSCQGRFACARARAPRLAHGSRSFVLGPVDQQIALRSFETRPVCTVRLFICAPAAWVACSASSATAAGTRTCRLNLPVVSYVAGYLRIAVRRFATRGPRARLTCGTFLAHCRPCMPRDFGGLHGARGGAEAPRQARSLVC